MQVNQLDWKELFVRNAYFNLQVDVKELDASVNEWVRSFNQEFGKFGIDQEISVRNGSIIFPLIGYSINYQVKHDDLVIFELQKDTQKIRTASVVATNGLYELTCAPDKREHYTDFSSMIDKIMQYLIMG